MTGQSDLETKEATMDLEKQASIVSEDGESRQVTLFDAVRKWTDDEGVEGFEVELDGKTLSFEQLQEIAHSDDYQNRLLAFNERLA